MMSRMAKLQATPTSGILCMPKLQFPSTSGQRFLIVSRMSESEEPDEPVTAPEKVVAAEPMVATASVSTTEIVKCPNCGLCDGSGRIAGGLGAVLPWIPIKAYRPCPNFVDRGGQYQRSGQGLDEIAFGRDSSFTRNK
ncbi:hypothetical protein ACA910_016098 [Epithemia clementina (nom. ined.)]